MPLEYKIIFIIFGSGVFMGLFFGVLFMWLASIAKNRELTEDGRRRLETFKLFTAGEDLKPGQAVYFGPAGQVFGHES